jgi:hypothetical protein
VGEDFYNALAWFKAAPGNFYRSGKEKLQGAAEWIWVVIQGDFAEEQSTAQIVTGTIISAIPFVDQICDVRDIVANCKKINEDTSNKWAWVALILTLIGLFPSLGSVVKGCFKILFSYGRKAMFSAGKAALDADLWKAAKPFVESGIKKVNDFLARPEVKRTLSKYKIDNPYKYLASKMRELAGKVNVGSLTARMDEGIKALKELLGHVKKYGGSALSSKADALIKMIDKIRRMADAKLGEALAPVQKFLDKLAKRLDKEHELAYKGATNTLNPHSFVRLTQDAEVALLKKERPAWLKVRSSAKYPATQKAPPPPPSHFGIGEAGPVRNAYRTFSGEIRHDLLQPGTVIYRVVDPKAADNGVYWMTKQQFEQLHSKSDWRDRFAVWASWNRNGEYVRYIVPKGKPLPVWRGTVASQQLRDSANNVVKADNKGNSFWLDGGAEQLVVNPAHLKLERAQKRQLTEWFDEAGQIEVNLIGVPSPTNWAPPRK